MATESAHHGDGWFSRERLLTLVLGGATLIALWVCYRMIEPFIPALAIATALAVATRQPHLWLRRRLRSRGGAAAASLILVTCVIVLPLSLLITYLVRQVIAGIQQLQAGGGISEWRSLLDLPYPVARAVEWFDANLDLQKQLSQVGQAAAAQAGNILAGSVNLLTQLVIMLFVLFFLYRDGESAIGTLRRLVPLSPREADRLFSRIEDTILATVNGSLTVAFLQAVLAGGMYLALGVPAAMVWASATFIVALVPVFGTFMVWGPVSMYLLISGSWIKAMILVGWGMLAVGTIDNILYPYLVGDRLQLHTATTFFAVVGGIGLFGPAGVIIGPVALAVTMGLLDVWWWRTTGGHPAEDALLANDARPPLESAMKRGPE